MANIDFKNEKNYKQIEGKYHKLWFCKPQYNTVVIDKLAYPQVVKALGRDYFTAAEIEEMQNSNPQKFAQIKGFVTQGIAKTVNSKTPYVVCGVLKQLSVSTHDDIESLYEWVEKSDLTTCPVYIEDIEEKMQENGYRWKTKTLDWQPIQWIMNERYRRDRELFACFVPLKQKGKITSRLNAAKEYNAPGVKHGLGDFVIAKGGYDLEQDVNFPILSNTWVVNGRVFSLMFDNRAFAGCFDEKQRAEDEALVITREELPDLMPRPAKGMMIDKDYDTVLDAIYNAFDADEKSRWENGLTFESADRGGDILSSSECHVSLNEDMFKVEYIGCHWRDYRDPQFFPYTPSGFNELIKHIRNQCSEAYTKFNDVSLSLIAPEELKKKPSEIMSFIYKVCQADKKSKSETGVRLTSASRGGNHYGDGCVEVIVKDNRFYVEYTTCHGNLLRNNFPYTTDGFDNLMKYIKGCKDAVLGINKG